jgi:3-(3-hydroxy-phenyl)propionate hydroxylase
MLLPDEPRERFEHADAVWPLLAAWDLTPANASLERHATYTFEACLVERWRHGRVVVAGDAAHRMPPFAGQGLCSGLRDAANLAWKLDLALAGAAGDDLVDSYGTERGPQVRAEIDFSVALGQIICILDPAEAAARDEGMIPAAAAAGPTEIPPPPPITGGVTRPDDPHAGELGRQGVVAHRGRVGRFDDVVAGGWVLISSGDDPALPGPLKAWWETIGGTTFAFGGAEAVEDVDGTYGRWFDELGAVVVLQRPDFHLFGTAPRLGGATGLVAALRAALGDRLPD